MSVTILPDFQAFARQQVDKGVFASEQEVVDAALRSYLADFDNLRTSIQDGLAELDRGEAIDGETFLDRLLVDTEMRVAARAR